MNTNLNDFLKTAVEYSQEAADVVTLAHEAITGATADRQKCAELVPSTVAALMSLTELDGTPFVPEGYDKKAAECLSSHRSTISLLNNVMGKYAQLRKAYDDMASGSWSLGTTKKTASTRQKSAAFDSADSAAMRRWTDRVLNDT
jgi:hypothetical protein